MTTQGDIIELLHVCVCGTMSCDNHKNVIVTWLPLPDNFHNCFHETRYSLTGRQLLANMKCLHPEGVCNHQRMQGTHRENIPYEYLLSLKSVHTERNGKAISKHDRHYFSLTSLLSMLIIAFVESKCSSVWVDCGPLWCLTRGIPMVKWYQWTIKPAASIRHVTCSVGNRSSK